MSPTFQALWSPETPILSPPAQYQDYYRGGGKRNYRWSRTAFFFVLLLINNIAWMYFSSPRGDALSIPLGRCLASSEVYEARPAQMPSTPGHKTGHGASHHAIARRMETIQIVMVMIGADSATEGAMTIKSALMFTSRPLAFHLVCDDQAIPIIKQKIELFSRPYYPLDISFYSVSLDAIKARAGRAGVGTKYSAGWGGLVKIFMHELLPTVERAIFVDTDMLFVVDPLLLWNTFSKLKPDQMVSFPTLGPKSDSSLICTCVMLLDLAAMRNVERPFMASTLVPSWAETAIGAKAFANALQGDGMIPYGTGSTLVKFDPMDPLWGDQGLMHVIWTNFPQYFAHLSLHWDITNCRKFYGVEMGHRNDPGGENVTETEQRAGQFWDGPPETQEQLWPGILHFNCQNNPMVWDFEENYNVNTWSPMTTMIHRYKWIWLNRGDGSAPINVNVVEDVRFQDERIADEERKALEEGDDAD